MQRQAEQGRAEREQRRKIRADKDFEEGKHTAARQHVNDSLSGFSRVVRAPRTSEPYYSYLRDILSDAGLPSRQSSTCAD
jgi:hypothetical protein